MNSYKLTNDDLPFLRKRIEEYRSGGFTLFIDDIRDSKFAVQNIIKPEYISVYEELYGEINWLDLTNEVWYKQYVGCFKPLISFDKLQFIEKTTKLNWAIYSQLMSASLEMQSELKGDIFKNRTSTLYIVKNSFGNIVNDIGATFEYNYPILLTKEMIVLFINIKKCQNNRFKQEYRTYLNYIMHTMREKVDAFYNDFNTITNAMLFEKLAKGNYDSFDELDKLHIIPSVKKQKHDLAKKKVDRAFQQNEIFKILYYENQ